MENSSAIKIPTIGPRGSSTIKRLFGYLRVPTPYFKRYLNICNHKLIKQSFKISACLFFHQESEFMIENTEGPISD